jgi:hypothetical protein
MGMMNWALWLQKSRQGVHTQLHWGNFVGNVPLKYQEDWKIILRWILGK